MLSSLAEEAYNPNGIVPRALAMIKSKFPSAIVCTDIALDPYSSQVYLAKDDDDMVRERRLLMLVYVGT
jgi:porphobilinogen synthase